MSRQTMIVSAIAAACCLVVATLARQHGLAKESTELPAAELRASAEHALAKDDSAKAPTTRLLPSGEKPQDLAGLQNFLQVTERIYSGGQPQGGVAFERLAELGVRTVVSVDGARPDTAAANAAGLKYLHIPMGYDGVSSHVGQSLTQLVRSESGPFYIHCHHGRHRGPAAAAVAAIAAGETTGEESCRVFEAAGVSPKYVGLWRDAAAFRVPDEDAKLPQLVTVAEVDSLAAAMARLDRHFDNLKRLHAAGWQAQSSNPDVTPVHEAVLTWEALRESSRSAALIGRKNSAERPLQEWMKEAEGTARKLESSLAKGEYESATQRLSELRGQCARCHRVYRD